MHEKLGKLDEAYRQLVEADRMSPGQLLTKLSLGENRFRAGKWREAALHLGALADHPDAAIYPEEVADAVAHAAQAEIKLRRPEKAIALYEAALTLRAGHRPRCARSPTSRSSAASAQKAATYLRRMAETTSRPARARAPVGAARRPAAEMSDDAQALRPTRRRSRPRATPGEEHVGLLEKTLELQRKRGEGEAAARTSALLIDLVKDPKERAGRRRDAALLMAERGTPRRRPRCWSRRWPRTRNDEDALSRCASWATRPPTRRPQGAPRRTLHARPPELTPPDGRRAPRARRARAVGAAWASCSASASPASAIDGVRAGRRPRPRHAWRRARRSSPSTATSPSYADAATEIHRRLLARTSTRADSLRALAAATRGAACSIARAAASRCWRSSARRRATRTRFLDSAPGARAQARRSRTPRRSTTRTARTHLALPEATLMAEIFSSLWEGAPGLIGQHVEDFGVSAQDKISPMSGPRPRQDLRPGRQGARQQEDGALPQGGRPAPGADEVTLVVQAPPALVVGGHLADGAPAAEVRFQLARGIELSRPEYILAAGVRPKQFSQLFANVLKAFHPRHARRRASAGDAAAEPAAS